MNRINDIVKSCYGTINATSLNFFNCKIISWKPTDNISNCIDSVHIYLQGHTCVMMKISHLIRIEIYS